MPADPRTQAALGVDERVRLDYAQTTDLLRSLTDVRFKLLALVPTLSGIAVALLGRPRPAAELLGVGLLGLVATVGVLVYDLRNTQVHDYALRRAAELEARLGLTSPFGAGAARGGGLYAERPSPSLRPFGLPPATYDRALGLVYGAAVAGWGYLAVWGALRAIDVGRARDIGAVAGIGIGLLVALELIRLSSGRGKQGGRRRVLLAMEDKQEQARPKPEDLVFGDEDDDEVEASGRPVDAEPDEDDDDVEAHGSWGGFG